MFGVAMRVMGRAMALSAGMALLSAPAGMALDVLEFRVPGADSSLEKTLRGASILLQSKKNKTVDAQDLFTDARAEYGNLLNTLYANGYYSGVIHVLIDGREAAGIAPLDAPAQIGRIEVTVEPGPKFTFSRARIAPVARGTELPEGFRVGQTAESGIILETATVGVGGWRDLGHAKARVSGQDLTADHAKATLSADISLDAGPRLRFGALKIEGAERMRVERIRAITGLPEGKVFSPAELERARERLRRTGVFKSITLAEDDRITPPDLLGITTTVVEEKRRHYSFGAEIASMAGLTLSGSWMHRNLFGGGERLKIEGQVLNIGSKESGVDYLLGVTLDRPATFTADTVLSLGVNLGHLDEADYKADIFSVSTGVNHYFNKYLTGSAAVEYAFARVTDVDGTTIYRSLALPIGATWDRRDNKTDATKGFYLDGEAKPFLGFGITDSGLRLMLDGRAYKSFGTDKRLVLAARVQAGAVLGSSLLGTPRDDLFYSGGGGTVRGQPYQSLGINVTRPGDDLHLGGTHFLGASLEARMRVTGAIGVVGFVDVGRVDADAFFGSVGDWHAGAGLGLRYATGVGPIRLDVAAPVGGSTGDGVQIYVGLGQAF